MSSGSLRILSELGGPSTCMLTLLDTTAARQPGIGARVEIARTAPGQPDQPLFTGQVDKFDKAKIPGTSIIGYEMRCVDYSCVLARRVYTGTIPAGCSLSGAVGQIMAVALAGEGFTIGGVDAYAKGLPKVQFQKLPVLDCLNELSRLTEYKWWVDGDKKLYFRARSTDSAPWELTDPEDYRDLTIQRERSQYRNVQYVLGTKITSDKPTILQWTSDGKQRVFPLASASKVSGTLYDEIASISWCIEIDHSKPDDERARQRLIGAPGSANIDYEYDVGGAQIRVAPGKEPPAKGIVLQVTMIGRYRIIGQHPDAAAIPTDPEVVSRKAWEGGTGIYEAVEVDESITDSGTAREKAQRIRDLHGHIPTIIEFETYRPGLIVGQNLRINLPNLGLDKSFLIDSSETTDERTAEEAYRLKWRIRCVASEVPKWQGYFAALLKQHEAPAPDISDEYQPSVYAPVDVLRISDSIQRTQRAYACADVCGSCEIGYSEVGS